MLVEKKLQIYIVEDMAISRASLESMLISNGYIISGSAAKAETAWKELQFQETDLVLIDIHLAGEENGVWLAQNIRKFLNIPIIYLTAYGDQQTLKEVIDTKPNGYLMKPYQEPTLLTSIQIALTNFLEKRVSESEEDSNTKKTIFIKDRYLRVKVTIDDIYFVKSDGNYLEIKLKEKTYVVRNKLSDFHEALPKDQFLQCHRRFIVNVQRIDLLGKDFISILGEDIPTATKYRVQIENKLSIV